MSEQELTVAKPLDTTSNELAARRTGMAFQRTRLAADRTLMAVIRTSLSLLSFGFTIHKVFDQLKEAKMIAHAASGRNFGLSLVLIGAVVLLMGIVYHAWFMYALRKQREEMRAAGILYAQSPFPPSTTLLVAILLLGLGIVTAISMIYKVGPFA